MQSPAIIQALQQIASDFRRGDLDAAYHGYRDLFASPSFATAPADDRREAIRQLVYTQGAPTEPTRAMRIAHDAALGPLRALIAEADDPRDRDMLRTCKVLLS